MTDSKTEAPKKGATRGGGQGAAANRPQQKRQQQRPPQGGPAARAKGLQPGGPRRKGSGSLDETIAQAQRGRVNVTPTKAIEMAGQLYTRRQYGQAERVCRQIIEARPGNADAHNILGVSLAGMGRHMDGAEAIKRAIKLNPKAPSYHANLGEVLRQGGEFKEAAEALENLEWEHKGYKRDVFGSGGLRLALVVVLIVCAVLGLLALTL